MSFHPPFITATADLEHAPSATDDDNLGDVLRGGFPFYGSTVDTHECWGFHATLPTWQILSIRQLYQAPKKRSQRNGSRDPQRFQAVRVRVPLRRPGALRFV